MDDEAQLLVALKSGAADAVDQVVRLHHGFLLAMVRPLVGDDAAKDVVQDTWIKALAAINGFEGRSKLRTWLARIALNEARGLLRKQGREVSLPGWGQDSGSPIADRFNEQGAWDQVPTAWHHDSPDALLTENELHECIEKHLHKLPDDQRGVVVFREMAGLDFTEIAQQLCLSEGNVRVLLHRARQRMHAMLDHFEQEGTC
ncbi:RNA polymerase sigma factor [Halopseudomonas salegens]|uniref:RNA polymerase sigma-70 factor, ECF subfamily n=1 Tax=Halopseudomonas salegens TaxID=1434072 RepID=A0A1H2DZ57_9GAMM|nr:RNA polymerase sigma factor [Halopseudomonas salegens]SDT88173.1 RNA polymerase sigma-70 factor, ECF subfamily [Halopseudomonas salegens]